MNNKPLKILLWDTDEAARSLMVLLLEQNGYEVIACGQADEAWRCLLDTPAALLLLTVTPDNFAEAEVLLGRSRQAFPVLVVFLSLAVMTGAGVQRLSRFQIDGFFQKPMDAGELLARLREVASRPVLAGRTASGQPKTSSVEPAAGGAEAAGVPPSPALADEAGLVLTGATSLPFAQKLERLRVRKGSVLITGERGSEFRAVVRHLAAPGGVEWRESAQVGLRELEEIDAREEARTVALGECHRLAEAVQKTLCAHLENKAGGDGRRTGRRFCFCSTANLAELEERSQFSSELYMHLFTGHIHLPPLRDRLGDVPLVAARIYRKFLGVGEAGADEVLDSRAGLRLMAHDWPGNFDQLVEVLIRAHALSGGAVLRDAVVVEAIRLQAEGKGFGAPSQPEPPKPKQITLDDLSDHMVASGGAGRGFNFKKYLHFHA